MEWLILAIIGVVYVIVNNLEHISIKFKGGRPESPSIDEPKSENKQLKK